MPQRIAIVGAGAAGQSSAASAQRLTASLLGMSAAYALSRHPERYSVTVFEQSSSAGGVATSVPMDRRYGVDYINDGVQGGSPLFYNTSAMFDVLGFKTSSVGMQVSFGFDPATDFWSNVFPSRVIDRCSLFDLVSSH